MSSPCCTEAVSPTTYSFCSGREGFEGLTLVHTSPSGEVQAWFAGPSPGPSPVVTDCHSGTLNTVVALADVDAHGSGRTENGIHVRVLADEEARLAAVREEAHRVDHFVHRGGGAERRHEHPVTLAVDEHIAGSTHGDHAERCGHAVRAAITRQRHDLRVLKRPEHGTLTLSKRTHLPRSEVEACNRVASGEVKKPLLGGDAQHLAYLIMVGRDPRLIGEMTKTVFGFMMEERAGRVALHASAHEERVDCWRVAPLHLLLLQSLDSAHVVLWSLSACRGVESAHAAAADAWGVALWRHSSPLRRRQHRHRS